MLVTSLGDFSLRFLYSNVHVNYLRIALSREVIKLLYCTTARNVVPRSTGFAMLAETLKCYAAQHNVSCTQEHLSLAHGKLIPDLSLDAQGRAVILV